jgi:proline dehydrogenase
MRRLLLALSERQQLKDIILRVPFSRKVALRFVAGETLDEALDASKRLNEAGLEVTLDFLGESVTDAKRAEAATGSYLTSLDTIPDSEARSSISLKPTQLGLAIDAELCYQNLLRIVGRAHELDNFVRIDMESSAYTQSTLDVFERVFERHSNVGVVIQSYMRRSEGDVARLVELGAPVRLCKGAYDEPVSVAFQGKEEVDASYVKLMKMLLSGGAPTAIATHDEKMVDATLDFVREAGIDPRTFEFQMLYGVRRDYQRHIASGGHRMRIYVPYGSEWYSYLMRRMAERPANLIFVTRAVFGD